MYKSIFISDTHLGSSWSNSKHLFNLLEHIESEQLFLLGDIVNSTTLKEHPDVMRFITLIQNKKWKIIYITGNHEEERINFPAVSLSFHKELLSQKSYIYNNGQTSVYLEHGHHFHEISKFNRLSRQLFSSFKRILLKKEKRATVTLNLSTAKRSKKSFYLSYIKPFSQRVLRNSFKSYISNCAKEKGCSVVVCGHFHIAEDSMVKGIHYLNCGDWVKHSSYVVESQEGKFVLKHWE